MQNIRFDDGFKYYVINGDENRKIRVHLTDFNILSRIETASAAFAELTVEHSPEGLAALDRAAREQIDYVFGEGTSDVLFGFANCASFVNGKPCFMNFLEAIAPVIRADLMAEKKKCDANVKKYTSQIGK